MSGARPYLPEARAPAVVAARAPSFPAAPSAPRARSGWDRDGVQIRARWPWRRLQQLRVSVTSSSKWLGWREVRGPYTTSLRTSATFTRFARAPLSAMIPDELLSPAAAFFPLLGSCPCIATGRKKNYNRSTKIIHQNSNVM